MLYTYFKLTRIMLDANYFDAECVSHQFQCKKEIHGKLKVELLLLWLKEVQSSLTCEFISFYLAQYQVK